jgi:hypothetical protein
MSQIGSPKGGPTPLSVHFYLFTIAVGCCIKSTILPYVDFGLAYFLRFVQLQYATF